MKRFLLAGLLVGCLGIGMIASAEESKSVDVMFLHDMHSRFNEFEGVEDGKAQTMGGLARVKTVFDEQRKANPDTLFLDAGDFSMGTLVQVVYEEEAAELRMLGELGMDAATFGNHEFDYGAKGIANMFDAAIESGDPLPELLVCNVDWEGMEEKGLTEDQQILKDAFEKYEVKDYVVLEKGDVKIAVFGVMGVDAEACIAECPVDFEDYIEASRETVAEIKAKEDVDMIACVSHSGVIENAKNSEDENLAKEVPEIDLIISGHTHTKLEEPIVHGDTYIVSALEYGKYVGSLSMKQNESGRWDMESYELIPIDKSVPKNEEAQAKIDYFLDKADTGYLEQFGYSKDQVLAKNDVEFAELIDATMSNSEVNLGCIIADAFKYAVELWDKEDTTPVDFAVIPGGVIRESYSVGDITVEDVYESFSLGMGEDGVVGYPLVSAYLTGEELKVAAEIDASISPFYVSARLHTSGLEWTFNPNRLILNRVTDVWLNVDGEKVEIVDDQLYRVVSDVYTLKMLGSVTDMSFGLLNAIPKDKDGNAIEDFNEVVITSEGKEVKAWVAIAKYMESFEDTDGDGVGEVPERYGTDQGRKNVEDSKNILKLINHPNKYAALILAAFWIVLLIIVVIILSIRNLIKKIIKSVKKNR